MHPCATCATPAPLLHPLRYNRVKVLVGTNLASAVVVCGLTAVHTSGTLWWAVAHIPYPLVPPRRFLYSCVFVYTGILACGESWMMWDENASHTQTASSATAS